MSFNFADNFQKGKLKGNCIQDLNKYKCPDCNSPFFVRGMDSYMHYVQCVKSDCLRIDLLPSDNQILRSIENLEIGQSVTFNI